MIPIRDENPTRRVPWVTLLFIAANIAVFIYELSLDCRFTNCTHAQEPGCAVRAALERGELSDERYRSYIKLKTESDHHAMSYVDRRKKDKAFGRFVKSAKKQMRKKH